MDVSEGGVYVGRAPRGRFGLRHLPATPPPTQTARPPDTTDGVHPAAPALPRPVPNPPRPPLLHHRGRPSPRPPSSGVHGASALFVLVVVGTFDGTVHS